MTEPASLRLVEDTLGELELSDATGVFVKDLDLGWPAPRVVADPRPGQDGEDDSTEFFGARVVTIAGKVVATDTRTRQDILDTLAAYAAPGRRPFAYYRLEPDGVERRVRLRGERLGAPISRPGSADVQLAWRAPDGVQEAADETIVLIAATVDVESGITFPITFPVTFPEAPAVGTSTVTNIGTHAIAPVLRLYGPVTNPRIENRTTGQTLEFTGGVGITLEAGQYLEVDVLERSVLFEGDEDDSRYDALDFSASEWWRLAPGANALRYYPESFDDPALAEVRYRPIWL